METIAFKDALLPAIRLLGRGKGGYSYLVEKDGKPFVLKQIHHEPCDYYAFGDKLQSELNDYQRLIDAGIPVPALIDVDAAGERLLKAYIEGPTVMERLADGGDVEQYLPAVRRMAEDARAHGLNIDYFPTNFVIGSGRLWYVDYECNAYMPEWDFEHWGVKYWAHSPELEAWMQQQSSGKETT